MHLPEASLFPCFAVTLATVPKTSHERKLWFLQVLKGLVYQGNKEHFYSFSKGHRVELMVMKLADLEPALPGS